MAPNIYDALVGVILKKNYWNISTIKKKTHILWMSNKDILEYEELILLRHIIVGLRKLVYEWKSDIIPSETLIAMFNSSVAVCLFSEELKSNILQDFKNHDEII